jgi:hypothetical protein
VVVVSERGQAQSRARLRLGDIGRLVAVWLVASAALALAAALLPNLTAEAPWAYFGATAVAGLLGLVFRPVLVLLAARIGWLAVVLAGLAGQALLVRDLDRAGYQRHFLVGLLGLVDRRSGRHRRGVAGKCGHR